MYLHTSLFLIPQYIIFHNFAVIVEYIIRIVSVSNVYLDNVYGSYDVVITAELIFNETFLFTVAGMYAVTKS